MRRHIVNHHKIKRRLERNLNKSHSLWSKLFGRSNKHKKDFSWQGRSENPYRYIEKPKITRFQIYIITIIVSLCATLYMVLFSSFFSLTNITIQGIQRMNVQEVHDAIQGMLDYKTFGFLPQKSYFTADISDMKDVLKERFPIEKIVIKKLFPNHLDVIIEEKISTLIYDNEDTYSYIDLEGKVVEIMRNVSDYEWREETVVTTSTNDMGEIEEHTEVISRTHTPDVATIIQELGNYPLVYDMRKISAGQINDIVLDAATVKQIVTWYNVLSRHDTIQPKYFILQNDMGELYIQTYDGWYIKTRVERDVDAQIGELETVFREKIKDSYISYIDLRYPGRVYWK